jgi:hypothetical protein
VRKPSYSRFSPVQFPRIDSPFYFSSRRKTMLEFLSEAEVYLLRSAMFLLFLVGLLKFTWYEISPIIREIRKTVLKWRR